MTGRELIKYASECTMDQLADLITEYKSQIELLEYVKKVRVKGGEKTSEMIKRDERKKSKGKAVMKQPVLQQEIQQPVQQQNGIAYSQQ